VSGVGSAHASIEPFVVGTIFRDPGFHTIIKRPIYGAILVAWTDVLIPPRTPLLRN
jgi:hypothetical protein